MTNFSIFSKRRFGKRPFFVFCDHACNAIPDRFNALGLPEDLLQTHIAFDIGAADTARRLAEILQGEYFACGYSRLLVDPNRSPDAKDYIPATSDQIPIPGNQMLSDADHRARSDEFHVAYHEALGLAIEEFAGKTPLPIIISVHSFTARLMGSAEKREWPIGVLWREDQQSADLLRDYLSETSGWRIGDNEPYDARVFNYSIDRHVGPRKLRHLTIEVRQDKVSDRAGVDEIASLLADGVLHVFAFHSKMGVAEKE